MLVSIRWRRAPRHGGMVVVVGGGSCTACLLVMAHRSHPDLREKKVRENGTSGRNHLRARSLGSIAYSREILLSPVEGFTLALEDSAVQDNYYTRLKLSNG